MDQKLPGSKKHQATFGFPSKKVSQNMPVDEADRVLLSP